MKVFAVRTIGGRERSTADKLAVRIKNKGMGAGAILVPSEIKGYILTEVEDRSALERIVKDMRYVRGVLKEEVRPSKIKHFLKPKPIIESIEEGDLVEIVSGPFKGEKAKVTRINKTKDKLTVEILEAAVPIPVTIKAGSVRVLKGK